MALNIPRFNDCYRIYAGEVLTLFGRVPRKEEMRDLRDHCDDILTIPDELFEKHRETANLCIEFIHNDTDAPPRTLLTCECYRCAPLIDHVEQRREVPSIEPIRPRMPKGFIYLMRHGRAGTLKIGYSKNPRLRESTLQAEDPDLDLIAYWPGTRNDEAVLHKRFSSVQTRGEWFRLSEAEVDALVVECGGISA